MNGAELASAWATAAELVAWGAALAQGYALAVPSNARRAAAWRAQLSLRCLRALIALPNPIPVMTPNTLRRKMIEEITKHKALRFYQKSARGRE